MNCLVSTVPTPEFHSYSFKGFHFSLSFILSLFIHVYSSKLICFEPTMPFSLANSFQSLLPIFLTYLKIAIISSSSLLLARLNKPCCDLPFPDHPETFLCNCFSFVSTLLYISEQNDISTPDEISSEPYKMAFTFLAFS